MTPTDEQQAIIDAYRTGRNLVIEAGAGTGKTTTLKMLGAERPGRKGIYIAYNKAIAEDAKRSFPVGVQCAIAHSFAYGAVGRMFRHRLNGPRIPAAQTAKTLGITRPLTVTGGTILAPQQTARLVMETVQRFCRSADRAPSGFHVPRKPGLDTPECLAVLREALPPLAATAWDDLTSTDGQLRFDHDVYLKLWQLSGPRLPADYVLLDEAQDANPVIAAIVESQSHVQLIAVGDRCQAIYGWRGAVDAMANFPADVRLPLAQSFRFGPAVADEANKWLGILHAGLRLRGYDRINSAVTSSSAAGTVLCRTNAKAMSEAMNAMAASTRKVAITGGGREILALAEAAITLKAGTGTSHPELFAFRTWGEVQDYAENDPGGSDLQVLVKLIDDHGPETIIDAVRRLSDERYASLIISTAHKAKGREWDTVRIAEDFREPKKNPEKPDELPKISPPEAMLAYVAVTRAKLTLDRSGLAWVDKYAEAAR
jgi:AAA domain/UvrD-like helicase C-terminal domain